MVQCMHKFKYVHIDGSQTCAWNVCMYDSSTDVCVFVNEAHWLGWFIHLLARTNLLYDFGWVFWFMILLHDKRFPSQFGCLVLEIGTQIVSFLSRSFLSPNFSLSVNFGKVFPSHQPRKPDLFFFNRFSVLLFVSNCACCVFYRLDSNGLSCLNINLDIDDTFLYGFNVRNTIFVLPLRLPTLSNTLRA